MLNLMTMISIPNELCQFQAGIIILILHKIYLGVPKESDYNLLKQQTCEAIFSSEIAGMIIVDKQGKIILSNSRAANMFGYKLSDMTNIQIEDLLPNKLRKAHKGQRQSFLKNPETRRMGEGRDLLGVKKNGKEFPIEISLSHTKMGTKDIVIAFIVDISTRKSIEDKVKEERELAQGYLEALRESEAKLLDYATELERRVEERTRELERAVAKLNKSKGQLEKEVNVRRKAEEDAKISLQKERELNELKSRFVSMASHEFRTPLSTILSSAGLIARYQEESQQSNRARHIDRIKNNVNGLNSILNDFLSLDKLETGNIPNHPEQVDLIKTIEGVVEELLLMAKKDQKLEFKTAIKDARLTADPQLIRNILLNLTSNAIKYSESGSKVNITLLENKNSFYVEIKDQGIGIPKEDQQHLFDRFFRARNAVNIQGTGLGLNLVKKYLDLVGGKISYSSAEGKGSTFTVQLPAK